jgi:hypothetical protein
MDDELAPAEANPLGIPQGGASVVKVTAFVKELELAAEQIVCT